MKKAEIKIGSRYVAKVSGALTTVYIDSESRYGGWNATNVKTGRAVRIKSAQRLRRKVSDDSPRARILAEQAEKQTVVLGGTEPAE